VVGSSSAISGLIERRFRTMIDHNQVDGWDGLGKWTPGAEEAERFKEDLYLRIVGTAETMNRILERRAETVLFNLQSAAAEENLDEERADVEMVAFCDSVEHSRFTYNWAHVMLTTRVVDTLKTLSSHLVDFRAKGKYSGKSEVLRLGFEFADRYKIDFSKCSTGDSFLEGMVRARNKIVHNGAAVWEASSRPDAMVVEGTENEWSPSECDQSFVSRFPEYVDSTNRITVTERLFRTNVERALLFVQWVGEQVDLFVRLLDKPSAGCSPT
jgi:hypothetical protein